MGFYLRKSVNAGPFRVNFSKSGVGASVGVRGLRIGNGPRGTYIHCGANGVYYRRVLSARPHTAAPIHSSAAQQFHNPPQVTDLTGFDASQLPATGPGELVDQLRAANRHQALWPWATGILVIMAAIASRATAPWVPIATLAAGAPAIAWLWWWDRRQSTATAVYDVNGPLAQWFTTLVAGYPAVVGLGGAWRIETTADVIGTYAYKVTGGAEATIGRKPLARSLTAPRTLTTNIAVPTLTHDRHALLFLPDRILIRHDNTWTDTDYCHLSVYCEHKKVIENERPPHDGTHVDTTWQYVNVRGGPDRRYRHNPQLPIMSYGHLTLSTPAGLHWVIDYSRPDVAEWFAAILTARPALP